LQAAGLPQFAIGWAQSHGNRPHQDDRCIDFVLPLPGGGSARVWAVSISHYRLCWHEYPEQQKLVWAAVPVVDTPMPSSGAGAAGMWTGWPIDGAP
jgi:hypothetical protein